MINKALVTAVALTLLPSFAMAASMTTKPMPAAANTVKVEKAKITKHHLIVKKAKAKTPTTKL